MSGVFAELIHEFEQMDRVTSMRRQAALDAAAKAGVFFPRNGDGMLISQIIYATKVAVEAPKIEAFIKDGTILK